eukprot:COSAG02_NODE_24667_length_680_cov_10.991394_1_plen_194_part_01
MAAGGSLVARRTAPERVLASHAPCACWSLVVLARWTSGHSTNQTKQHHDASAGSTLVGLQMAEPLRAPQRRAAHRQRALRLIHREVCTHNHLLLRRDAAAGRGEHDAGVGRVVHAHYSASTALCTPPRSYVACTPDAKRPMHLVPPMQISEITDSAFCKKRARGVGLGAMLVEQGGAADEGGGDSPSSSAFLQL